MVFNPDPTKQAQEILFSKTSHYLKHPDLYFNSLIVERVKTQKHLGIKLVQRLNFRGYLKDKFVTVNEWNWDVEKIE